VLNAAAILLAGGVLAYQAWRGDRRPAAGPGPAGARAAGREPARPAS
jgi:hypothetical protein